MTDLGAIVNTTPRGGGGEPTIVTAKKEKDPRRVEAGKRLAAISKQAKERKRVERESSALPSLTTGHYKYMAILTTAGVAVALATLWYTMYPAVGAKKKTEEPPNASKELERGANIEAKDTHSLETLKHFRKSLVGIL